MADIERWDGAKLRWSLADGGRTPEEVEEALAIMQPWFDRGDGVAIYENHDLGHHLLGDKVYLSFGSPAAQLESAVPPTQCPDGLLAVGGGIGWRYTLIATVPAGIPTIREVGG